MLDTIIARFIDSWPWFIIRGAGFLALVLLILLMLSGIGQVTGWTYRFIEPLKAWLLHKWLSFALVAVIIIHVVALLFDHYVSFKFIDLLVPFSNTYGNGSTLFGISLAVIAVASGIVAMYGIFYIVITSLYFINTKKKFWKYSHYVSYVSMALVFVHALGTGTDTTNVIIRATLIGLLILLIGGSLRRISYSNRD